MMISLQSLQPWWERDDEELVRFICFLFSSFLYLLKSEKVRVILRVEEKEEGMNTPREWWLCDSKRWPGCPPFSKRKWKLCSGNEGDFKLKFFLLLSVHALWFSSKSRILCEHLFSFIINVETKISCVWTFQDLFHSYSWVVRFSNFPIIDSCLVLNSFRFLIRQLLIAFLLQD